MENEFWKIFRQLIEAFVFAHPIEAGLLAFAMISMAASVGLVTQMYFLGNISSRITHGSGSHLDG